LKINHEIVAVFIGLNIGFLLVWNRGFPEDTGTILQRIARALIALIVYILADQTLGGASQLLFQPVPGVVVFMQYSLTVLLCVWGSTEISIKLNLFQRQPE
jgi:hypothetical protein